MALKLALEGGSPVRNTMLRYSTQSIDDDDRRAVEQVLKGDWLTTGPAVSSFENALCEYTGAKHAVAVNSGTAALHLATCASGIGVGDEVIVPAISFVASANCVLYQGARPVFADLCPQTLNIDPVDVERKITPKTRAIVAVDFAGHPCHHDELYKIARNNEIKIIEDAAHSLGATYKGKRVGVLQEMSTLSFHPVKHITTGEGGAILTDDESLSKTIRSLRHHGIDLDFHARGKRNTWEYDVVALGYNYRIPDINCALGISQLSKLDQWIQKRRTIVEKYRKAFKEMPMMQLPEELDGCNSSWHLYVVRLNMETLSVSREKVFAALNAENIGVNVHYIPIPWMTYYSKLGYKKGQWPVAEKEYERLLSIPLFPSMTENDIDDVVNAFEKVWNAYRR